MEIKNSKKVPRTNIIITFSMEPEISIRNKEIPYPTPKEIAAIISNDVILINSKCPFVKITMKTINPKIMVMASNITLHSLFNI